MKKMKKISLVVLAVALVIFGVTYVGTKADEVKASATLVMSEDKSYGTLTKDEALATINANDDLTGNDIPNYEGYLFAGWFADENGVCSLDTAVSSKDDATHAKFVKEDTLSVKMQIVDAGKVQDATNGAIRFISSVDSLDYSQVGFKVDGTDYPVVDNVVYERIDSTMLDTDGEKIVYEYSPKIVGTKAEYFFTAKLAADTTSKDYKVQAYWKTVDGTKVYGQERTVCVNDNASNIINMTLDGALVKGATHNNVAIVSEKNSDTDPTVDTTASVYVTNVGEGYSNVRITLPSTVKVSQFASATTITVGSASGIFRNHNTAYAGTAATIDTSWYDEYSSTETEFVISGSADLYGMASLSASNDFLSETIYAISDITVNSEQLKVNDDNSVTWHTYDADGNESTGTSTPVLTAWTPIGQSTIFAGTFDGQGHEISGIYSEDKIDYSGLFGRTSNASTVRNFKINNSYFATSARRVGSVAGEGNGDFYSIKSSAIVVSSSNGSGGIVGFRTNGGKIADCWFDGYLCLGASGTNGGGILGQAYISNGDDIEILGCYNNGKLSSSITSAVALGGICGNLSVSDVEVPGEVLIEDCLSLGSISSASTGGYYGAITGRMLGSSKMIVTINNTYADSDLGCTYAVRGGSSDAFKSLECNGVKYTATAGIKLSVFDGKISTSDIGGSNGWYKTTLDFGTYWSAINGGTPQLKSFAEGTILDTLGGRGTETEPWLIANGEDLKTLANYAESTYDFNGKYIKLGNNITVVEGATVEEVKTNATENWKPIGTTSKSFAGNFNGDGMTISGIYYNGSGTNVGLFGQTNQVATITDFTLVNSYLGTTATSNVCIGSVAGRAYGTFSKIKSTATVESGGSLNGGIAGAVWTWGGATFSDCWFAGKIYSNYETGGAPSGGIVGGIRDGKSFTTTIQNCLNTGEIISKTVTTANAQVGGICGLVAGTTTVNVINCVNAKPIECYAGRVGTIFGDINSATSVTITNCFGIKRNNDDITDTALTVYGNNGIGEALVVSGNSVLEKEQMEAEAILEKANVLFVNYTDNVIHWVTTDTTPILSCFAN